MKVTTVCLGALACAGAAHGFTAPVASRAMHTPVALRSASAQAPSVALRMSETPSESARRRVVTVAAGVALAFTSFAGVGPALAVSGGVNDFGDVAGQDFSGQNLSRKDFSGANAQNTKFQKSILKGTRFFKADLKGADFTGADLTNASLENSKLDGVLLTNAVLKGVYTDQDIEKVKDISGADFSDAQIRPDIQQKLCARPDATGANPKTKADTRESLMCP